VHSGHSRQRSDSWRGGRFDRQGIGSSKRNSRRKTKGNKLLALLLLLLVVALAVVFLEVLRSYSGGKLWFENIQPAQDSGDD
jgi:hypothetical protein